MSENKNSKTKIVPCSVQPSCKDIVDLLNLLLFFSVVKVFSYVQQLLHLLYSYSYFSHMFCDHLYVSTLLVRIYMALFSLPYGAKGANMPYKLRYNNCTIILTTITITFSIGFQRLQRTHCTFAL